MSRIFYQLRVIILLFILGLIVAGCAFFRDFQPDSSTDKCSHCHGSNLEGINNTKAYCGKCHDISNPVTPENVSDRDMKEALLSEPHIHKIKNVYSGTPSCFNCHRPGSF